VYYYFLLNFKKNNLKLVQNTVKRKTQKGKKNTKRKIIDLTGNTEGSKDDPIDITEEGWYCVKPYNKRNATKKERVQSCENTLGAETDKFQNRQKCIEECHIKES
jgi:hypothetical protein